jgi:DNA-binding transcriptional MocR family regulator
MKWTDGIGRSSDPTFVGALGNWAGGSGPAYRRLADAVKKAIESGEIAPGSRLPAERILSRLLAVSRTTVVAAYELLRQERLVESRQGSGTRVRGKERRPGPFREDPTGSFRRHPVYRRLIEGSGGTIEFLGAHLPACEVVSRELTFVDRASLAELAKGPGYVPMGLPALRRAVAAHVTGWGLPSGQEHILISNGAQQAIGLAASLFVDRGDAVVVENPTYLGAIDIFAAQGARLVPVPARQGGVDVEALRDALARTRPRLVYLMPTYQNPTGSVLSERDRRRVARLASEAGVPIVEDLTLADLALGPAPPPPIGAFAGETPVLTIGSMSKLFWGGLRVGWIRASEEVLARIAKLKIMADLGASLVGQLVATRLLSEGARVRQARRREIRERLDRLTKLFSRHLPDWSWAEPAGGLSLWVKLPRGDASEFAQVALRHGVSVVPGPLASPDGGCTDHLRVPYVLEAGPMTEGVERLARAWATYSAAARRERQSVGVLV